MLFFFVFYFINENLIKILYFTLLLITGYIYIIENWRGTNDTINLLKVSQKPFCLNCGQCTKYNESGLPFLKNIILYHGISVFVL